MSSPYAFGPNFSKTQVITATSTSASATLDATDVSSTPTPANSGPSGGHSVMRIVVQGTAGTGKVFLRWGVGAQTALVTDMPMLSGTVELFSKASDVNTVAAITSGSDTANVYITCGEGL